MYVHIIFRATCFGGHQGVGTPKTSLAEKLINHFKLNKFYVLLPEDGCRPPKHVGGENCMYILYTLYVQIVGF